MSDVLLIQPHILREKKHQRDRKEGLTFKISCTLGLSGAFAPGKLTWVPRENALKDHVSVSFVWYCAGVLSNKSIEIQRMQIFTVMFFGFSGERLKSTSICIALLFAFDINFLTHVEYNLGNDIWLLFVNSTNYFSSVISLNIQSIYSQRGQELSSSRRQRVFSFLCSFYPSQTTALLENLEFFYLSLRLSFTEDKEVWQKLYTRLAIIFLFFKKI